MERRAVVWISFLNNTPTIECKCGSSGPVFINTLNTFSVCEFKKGGRWSFFMHGPDGHNYPNESVFADIEPPHKVAIQHVVEPIFRLTIALAASATGTRVSWSQAFESAEVAGRVEHIVVPANEQNLDRLAAEVLRQPDGR